ncbi:MAG: tRNA (adenosine(37)-N6)-threonylcarbamoyltransferase complex transferase subunit TsaD [Deltaproteobacteria bacterium]|nr:tRNA (adenosine(37)-N6)-threonylcarbamoyltransferase complex transferase subunit TsaD [Deltaproteobacteria bacterium]
MKILGIETSCDETAAAVIEDGRRILSSVVASQVDVHHPYGGVVPEIAARCHMESIVPVVAGAMDEAGIDFAGLDAIGATRGPGLVGALLVGFSFAKAMGFALNIPWTGIDHLEGHLNSVFLAEPAPDFPFTALLVSGGHTAIYLVRSHVDALCMGRTRDDAAGEAFDKVAKMLDLGYPGGGVISRMAETGDPDRIKFPRAFMDRSAYDFSFSGLKTSVKRYIDTHGDFQSHVNDIAASFQEACVDVLAQKLMSAALENRCAHVAVVGGVAANSRLRQRVLSDARKHGLKLFIPPVSLCGDNAAMIAAAAFHRLTGDCPQVGNLADDVYSRVERRL